MLATMLSTMLAAVLAADPTALVLRTNVVYGPEKVGKNFVYQLVRKLAAGEATTKETASAGQARGS